MKVFQIIFASLLLMLVSQPVHAASLEEVVDEYAEVIAKFLQERGQKSVAFDSFSGPRIGTGKSIATQLQDALKSKGITIAETDLDAEYVVRGSHSQLTDGAFAVVGVEVRLFSNKENVEEKTITRKVRLKFGQDIAKIEEFRGEDAKATPQDSILISNSDQVEQLTAPSFDVSGAKSQNDKNAALQESLKHPGFQQFAGSQSDVKSIVAANETSLFKMELLVDRPSADGSYDGIYEPLNIENRNGLAFAPFEKGDRYAVNLINESDFDVGVALEIDGINSMSLSEVSEFREVGKWVVPRKSQGRIKGYHLDNRQVASFLVDTDDRQESEVRKLAPPAKIGTVSAAFFAAWNEGEDPPPFAKSLGNLRSLVTTPGPRIDNPSDTVKKNFCQTSLARVTVRYSNPQPSEQGGRQQVNRPVPAGDNTVLNAALK